MTNLPYVIQGTITDSTGANPSGIQVTARNDRSIENVTTTTDANGAYLIDIGNLTSGYVIGDSITVIVRNALEDGSSSFTIASGEASQSVDITMTEIVDSSDVSYCSLQDVYDELDGKTTTNISAARVRNEVLRAEAEIDKRTGTSFKSNTFTDEIYDINLENLYCSPNVQYNNGLARQDGGIAPGTRTPLNHRPILTITSLYTNSGGPTSADSWTLRSENSGSGGDFLVYKKKGMIEWLQNAPTAQRRAFKVSGTWGLDRTSTKREDVMTLELVKRLTVLIAIKQILSTKISSSTFNSVDSISLESISITKGAGDSSGYVTSITAEIDSIFDALGSMPEWSISSGQGDY